MATLSVAKVPNVRAWARKIVKKYRLAELLRKMDFEDVKKTLLALKSPVFFMSVDEARRRKDMRGALTEFSGLVGLALSDERRRSLGLPEHVKVVLIVDPDDPPDEKMIYSFLVHELTHVVQYSKSGRNEKHLTRTTDKALVQRLARRVEKALKRRLKPGEREALNRTFLPYLLRSSEIQSYAAQTAEILANGYTEMYELPMNLLIFYVSMEKLGYPKAFKTFAKYFYQALESYPKEQRRRALETFKDLVKRVQAIVKPLDLEQVALETAEIIHRGNKEQLL